MRTTDQIHVMLLQEARHDVRAECEGNTAVVLAPAGDIFVWIGPKQVTEQTAVGNLVQLAGA